MSSYLPEVGNAVQQILQHHRSNVQRAYDAYTKAMAEATARNVTVKEVDGKIIVQYRQDLTEENGR